MSSKPDEQLLEHFHRHGSNLLNALCHRELHPDRLEAALAEQMSALVKARPPEQEALPTFEEGGVMMLSEQVLGLLPPNPKLMPSDEYGLQKALNNSHSDTPPWLPLSEPATNYTSRSLELPRPCEPEELKVWFSSSGRDPAGRYMLPAISTPVHITPRLPAPFDSLSSAYHILMKEVFALLWQQWKHLLALNMQHDYASELHACYDAVYTSFIKWERVLLGYPKLRDKRPEKMQQKLYKKYNELLSPSGTAEDYSQLRNEAFRCDLLRPWVAYQMRQHSLGLLCAFYESQPPSASAEEFRKLPFRLYAYDELFMNALNQAAPCKKQELLFFSKLSGQAGDCCTRSDCEHTWINIMQCRSLYRAAVDIDITQKELRERLGELNLPYLEKNRENRAIKTCYLHLVIEQDKERYKK